MWVERVHAWMYSRCGRGRQEMDENGLESLLIRESGLRVRFGVVVMLRGGEGILMAHLSGGVVVAVPVTSYLTFPPYVMIRYGLPPDGRLGHLEMC